MTTQNILFPYDTGSSTLTFTLYQSDGTTVVQSGIACTETGSGTGWYIAPVTASAPAGTYKGNLLDGSTIVGNGAADLDGVNGTYDLQNIPTAATISANINLTPSFVIPAAIAQASLTPGLIGVTRGDTYTNQLPLLGNITSRTKLVFTAKLNCDVQTTVNTDSKAIIQISESGGLLRLNGAAATDSTLGSLTVTNATTGAVTLTLKPGITSTIPIEDLVWDAQWWAGAVIQTPTGGTMSITADVTQSIV